VEVHGLDSDWHGAAHVDIARCTGIHRKADPTRAHQAINIHVVGKKLAQVLTVMNGPERIVSPKEFSEWVKGVEGSAPKQQTTTPPEGSSGAEGSSALLCSLRL
jgi:hypothetical protein